MSDTSGPGVTSSAGGWKDRKAVGYLAGRGGEETLTPEATISEIRAHFSELRSRVDALEAEAIAIEEGMAEVNQALRWSQPPMFKRTSVRWWVSHGGRRREPVVVQELGGPNGRAKPTPVDSRVHLRTDRGFGLCADLARQAFRAFWALRAVRRETHDRVAALARAVKPLERRGAVVSRVRAEMAGVTLEARRRLREVGYSGPEEAAEE